MRLPKSLNQRSAVKPVGSVSSLIESAQRTFAQPNAVGAVGMPLIPEAALRAVLLNEFKWQRAQVVDLLLAVRREASRKEKRERGS